MIQRIPQLVDQLVGEDLLCLGSSRKSCDELNRPLHNHRLVILLHLSLDLGPDEVKQSLPIWILMLAWRFDTVRQV